MDHEEKLSTAYTKTFENIQGIKMDTDEHVPLIPKPPSYEMALSEINSKEAKDDELRVQKENDNDTQPKNQLTALVEINSQTISSSQLHLNTNTNLSATPTSSTPLESNSLFSLKSLYNDAKLLYANQVESILKDSNESTILKPYNTLTSKDPLASSDKSKELLTSSENNPPSNINQQKVRFNLEPMRLNDVKHANKCKDSKRLRLQDANLSYTLQDYSFHRSPSDPSVCLTASTVEHSNRMSFPPDLPPRERKVRFQTGTISPSNDPEPPYSFQTLPRNHKIHQQSDMYANIVQKRNEAEEARWSLIPTDFSYSNYNEDRDPSRLVALEQRTHQLDNFLTEYKDLQLQLIKMRHECDNLRQENLKKDMEALKSTILNQPCKSLDKQDCQNTNSASFSRRQLHKEVVVKPILKNNDVSKFILNRE